MDAGEPLLRWRTLLDILSDHGVSLETTELETLTEDGERSTARFLVRWVNGRPLYHVVGFVSMDDPVPRFEVRRIAIALDLPPEVFILPDEPW